VKIAMLGGTFDPIHVGHVRLGQHFARLLGLNKVLIIPTRTPPHKKASVTAAEHRMEMCRITARCAGDVFEASDIELRRDGLSYSYYTIVSLREQYPDSEIYFLTGADMFMILDSWHRYDELRELATFCTVARDDITIEQLEQKARQLQGCRSVISEMPQIDLSSTMIRSMAAGGESITGLVLPEVEEYIARNGLYRRQD